jgi:ubiquitin C-terminal hydrolase
MMKDTPSAKYNLFGVINHMGGMGGGHYTAFVQTPVYNDVWVEFDDATVSKVDKESVISKESYVLFYRRQD